MTKSTLAKERKPWSQLTPSQQRVVVGIRNHGPLNRELLGQHLGWPASAVSREVSPLLVQKLLFSDPPGLRRRKALLSNSPTIGHVIGIEIGFEHVRGATVDFNGKPVGQPKQYNPDNRTSEAFLRCLQKVIRELMAQPPGKHALGIGIGFADRASWNPLEAFSRTRPAISTPSLVASTQASFELPVTSRGDAACAALGEWRHGRLRHSQNGLFLLYEQGIGLGIIASGRVVFGGWNDAGEIGHIPLDDDGEYCHCGNVGCLETIASSWALQREAKQIMDTGGQVGFRQAPNSRPRVNELCALAKTGDPLARNMLTKAGRAIGRALAISASLFDPEIIVLGGALSDSDTYQPLIAPIRESFETLTAHRTPQPIKIETSSLGENAIFLGAAELVFTELLGSD
jgi:predicted NBD/HSP70 family sugar kinase